jgi:protoporphyrinogen oxidase
MCGRSLAIVGREKQGGNLGKVIVLGAGPMGLAAAFEALRGGHEVDVLEATGTPGGMAAHFDFGGISIERFYHFVCGRITQPSSC